jgi:mono/diheme cytochrome c family protein
VEDAMAMPPPPSGWGRGEGLFFGKRRPYPEVFAMVHDGGPPRNGKRSEMPPWRGKISREQIWAVLYFLAYQSGGLEAPFPPSLQPRQSDEIRRVLE